MSDDDEDDDEDEDEDEEERKKERKKRREKRKRRTGEELRITRTSSSQRYTIGNRLLCKDEAPTPEL